MRCGSGENGDLRKLPTAAEVRKRREEEEKRREQTVAVSAQAALEADTLEFHASARGSTWRLTG